MVFRNVFCEFRTRNSQTHQSGGPTTTWLGAVRHKMTHLQLTNYESHRRGLRVRGETGERMASAFRWLGRPRTVPRYRRANAAPLAGSAFLPTIDCFQTRIPRFMKTEENDEFIFRAIPPFLRCLRSLLFKKTAGSLGSIWRVGRAKRSLGTRWEDIECQEDTVTPVSAQNCLRTNKLGMIG